MPLSLPLPVSVPEIAVALGMVAVPNLNASPVAEIAKAGTSDALSAPVPLRVAVETLKEGSTVALSLPVPLMVAEVPNAGAIVAVKWPDPLSVAVPTALDAPIVQVSAPRAVRVALIANAAARVTDKTPFPLSVQVLPNEDASVARISPGGTLYTNPNPIIFGGNGWLRPSLAILPEGRAFHGLHDYRLRRFDGSEIHNRQNS